MTKELDQIKESNQIHCVNNEELMDIEDNSIFRTDEDTFDISIQYYRDKIENKFIVKDVHDIFDENSKNIKTLIITFKYPSFKDFIEIYNELTKYTDNLQSNNNLDMSILQLQRVKILIRKWNLNKDISTFQEMDFSLMKAVFINVINKIGFDGIV